MAEFPCVLLLLLLVAGNAATIKIGVVINTNSHTGREQKIAMDIAAQHFNSSATTLFINFKEIGSNNPFRVASNDLVKQWGAEAIIATGTWPEVAATHDVGSSTNVPVLLPLATPPLISSPRPNMVFMSPRATPRMRCLVELVKSYRWRRVIVIYEDDDYGTVSGSVNAILSGALQEIRSGIDDHLILPPLDTTPDPRAAIRQELERVRRRLCKVFVVLRFSPSASVHLFKEAHALGMMSKGHAWIVADDALTSILDSYQDNTFSISPYAQGIVGIKPHFTKAKHSLQAFTAQFKHRFQLEYGEMRADHGIAALHAYDAVHVLALAVTKKETSDTLLQGIWSSNLEGLTGHLSFVKNRSLVVREGPCVFQIINFVGKSYRELGFWLEGYGFYEDNEMGFHRTRVDYLGPMYWPGGPERVPGGWGKLRIGVPARTIFDQFVEVKYDEKGNVKSITGYCIDVFKETLRRFEYDLAYEFLPFNGSYDELIDQVALKKYDAVVGDVTILANRAEKVEFTQPYVGSGLAMLVQVKPDSKAWMFLKPFTCGVWLWTALVFIYTIVMVWYFESRNNNEFEGPWSAQLRFTLWLIFTPWSSIKKIQSYYTMVVIMVWFIVAFIMTLSYTASMSSILTTQKLEPVVSYRRIGCDGDSFVVKYMQEVLGYTARRIHLIATERDYPKAFERGKITAALMETPYLRVFLSRHDDYTVHGETHRLGGFGFVFPKGSPLAADVSEAILQLSEEGVLMDLENKWFSLSFTNSPSTEKNRKRDSLTTDHLLGLFLLSLVTTTSAFLLFILSLRWRNPCHINAQPSTTSDTRQPLPIATNEIINELEADQEVATEPAMLQNGGGYDDDDGDDASKGTRKDCVDNELEATQETAVESIVYQ